MRSTIARSACAAILLVGLLAGPVLGGRPDRAFGGEIPDFDLPDVCAFPLTIHIVVNNEYVTTFFDEDGNPESQLLQGRLIAEVIRSDTGDSVVLNASGPARIDAATGDFTGYGHFLQWGDGINGLLLFRGQHDFDGNGQGSALDVCALLE
ncbi:MAG TPA: hypothetical protein VFV72_01075 [Candidatus Limnocylindrales bacterium]|nr:hypothetical protein [Candidatus Limnocylindrales bacterium]